MLTPTEELAAFRKACDAMQEASGTVHELKTWPGPFKAMKDGLKHFEFRRNDRDYKEGDILFLNEWEPAFDQRMVEDVLGLKATAPTDGKYTGESLTRIVTYVLGAGIFGVPKGYCILGLAPEPLLAIAKDLARQNAELREALRDTQERLERVVAGLPQGWRVPGIDDAIEHIRFDIACAALSKADLGKANLPPP